ncbi:MAG: peptidylprolyl isomerase [Alphaproteobacteria bacterium]
MKRTIFAVFMLFSGQALAADAAPADAWRDVDPKNLVLIDVQYGRIAVELAPEFAPRHTERLRRLIGARYYDGLAFYRVIDGFVAQGGIGEGTASTGSYSPGQLKKWPALKREFEQPIGSKFAFMLLGNADLFWPEVGHVNGFPAGRDASEDRIWPLHCPGTFAFARDVEPDTATTEFYIVIGTRPPRLERNMTAVGRVIDGMQYVQKLERGDPDVESGVIQDKDRQDKIIRMRLAADLPAAERPKYQVMRTDSEEFAKFKESKRNIDNPFFFRKPLPILDICALSVPVRRTP